MQTCKGVALSTIHHFDLRRHGSWRLCWYLLTVCWCCYWCIMLWCWVIRWWCWPLMVLMSRCWWSWQWCWCWLSLWWRVGIDIWHRHWHEHVTHVTLVFGISWVTLLCCCCGRKTPAPGINSATAGTTAVATTTVAYPNPNPQIFYLRRTISLAPPPNCPHYHQNQVAGTRRGEWIRWRRK